MRIFTIITGPPRIGKTTVILSVAEKLKAKGYILGGMVSQEIREKGVRVGFDVHDYSSSRKAWLAHIRQPFGPRIGKYRVNLDNLNSIGTAAILKALEDANLVLIDEIGPMELLSEKFVEAVKHIVKSSKPLVSTIHYRANHSLMKQIKSNEDADVIDVTLRNRSHLPDLIANKVITLMHASET